MIGRHPIRPGIAAVFAAMSTLAAAAQETDRNDPVGWPLRPAEDDPSSAETSKEPAPGAAPPAEPPPASPGSSPPRRAAPRVVSPDADIGALERIVLPIEPLSFSFRGERTALTRREARALDRLALRLRLHPEPIVVTGYASQERYGREESLRLALTRALAVRHYLIEEGAAERLIEVVASVDAGAESDIVTVAPLGNDSSAASQ